MDEVTRKKQPEKRRLKENVQELILNQLRKLDYSGVGNTFKLFNFPRSTNTTLK